MLTIYFDCSIAAVMEVYPDTDPLVLYELYKEVGRDKELLLEAMMHGGQLPESARMRLEAQQH